MAEAFAAAGADVAVVAREESVLQETVAALNDIRSSGRFVGISADVSDAAHVERAHSHAVEFLGPIDVLVNNAGTSNAQPFLQVDDQSWLDDFNLKFFSAVRLCRLCIPEMQQQGWGRIINTLNSAAKAPSANSCPTSVARAAGMAMTKVLATEFAADGILVNALNTGLLVSHQWVTRWEADPNDQTFDQFINEIGRRIPIGRMGDPREFANLALFLASDAASYLTGAAINIDGGLTPVV
jgi:NAD(P)-dependent dehydrogenase (short-subunit alcohol dehydrogenase family)